MYFLAIICLLCLFSVRPGLLSSLSAGMISFRFPPAPAQATRGRALRVPDVDACGARVLDADDTVEFIENGEVCSARLKDTLGK